MNDRVKAADARVEAAYRAGMENARIPLGSPRRKPGIFANGELSREFQSAYKAWMNERALARDYFALSLGYPLK